MDLTVGALYMYLFHHLEFSSIGIKSFSKSRGGSHWPLLLHACVRIRLYLLRDLVHCGRLFFVIANLGSDRVALSS